MTTNRIIDFNSMDLNQILYGPPGTGKTYHTINMAISIIERLTPKKYKNEYASDTDVNNRKKLKTQFDKYLNDGRIQFCTFHQTFSYEDFIEGIKPINPEETGNNLLYQIEPGIFQKMCIQAAKGITSNTDKPGVLNLTDAEFERANFFKLSLGNSQDENDQEILDYCIKESCIALGWGQDVDFSNVKNENELDEIIQKNISKEHAKNTREFINRFISQIDSGDYVVVSKGNLRMQAIGRVTGPYYFDNNSPIKFKQFRKVEWLKINLDVACEELYERQFSQKTLYELDKHKLKKEFFTNTTKKRIPNTEKNPDSNFVLIIDEINRGNISQIFGELITLIEKEKRKPGKETLEVILPYSKVPFSVPNNLYIIGTMNTADRSVEALDSALRRRFSFIEMMPDSRIIDSKPIEGIDLQKLLEKINERLEVLLSKEHTIGHTYLLGIKNIADLKHAFNNKIIPLLKEYFYGDFGKISMVIGVDFVNQNSNKSTSNKSLFMPGYSDMIEEYSEVKPWIFTDIDEMKDDVFINAVKSIYA